MSSSVLKTQHTSLQFSDTREQQRDDVEKLFKKGKAFPIKTGTESGPESGNDNREFLLEMAKDYNHRIVFAAGNWVAVDRSIAKPNSFKKHDILVAEAGELKKVRGHDRRIAGLSFTHVDDRIGRVTQGVTHYANLGQKPGQPNYGVNVRIAQAAERWMRNAGRGHALAFLNGDFNTNDRVLDFAHGEEWTSMADELQRWKDTGHGPIDGLASFNRDGRVKAKKLVVLDDSELHMHTDHYVLRGTWTIRHLKLS